MKRMLFLGALVLGVTVCSQSYGFEILDRVLGHHRRASCTSCAADPGCGAGDGCADACEPGCGAGNGCLGGGAEPGCGAGNGCLGGGAEPGCGAGNGCADPSCGAGNGCADSGCTAAPKCRKKHSLFGGMKGLFDGLKKKHHGCTSSSCCGAEPACDAGNGCLGGCGAEPGCGAGNGCGCSAEPGCGAGNGCAEPACGAGNGCADAGCTSAPKCRKAHKSILGGFFKALHSKKGHKSCTSGCCDACEPGCGADPGCGAGNGCGNGCSDPACGAVGMIETVPTQTAARKTSKMVQVSRTVTAK